MVSPGINPDLLCRREVMALLQCTMQELGYIQDSLLCLTCATPCIMCKKSIILVP
uniref:Uncharacterized protein n=1 Tax=Arundo donax TaxID=35708 RepID=A0A0A9BB55_ARUDO